MHVITKKRIHEAIEKFPESESALHGWYRLISKNNFHGFASLKACFASVDKVGSLYVFDVAGNKLRIITSIHFNRQRVYIRHILNHSDYDKQKWKKPEKST